jgi:hypothetical protein
MVDRQDHGVTLTDEGDPPDPGTAQLEEAFVSGQDSEARMV